MNIATILAILAFSLLGLAGGAVGTYFSIKNTNGPLERAFMIRVAIVSWLAVTAFIVGLYLVPNPYRFLLWIPYMLGLVLGIGWCNRRQMEIRAQEAASHGAGSVKT